MALSFSAAPGRHGTLLIGLLVLGLAAAVGVVWRVHTADAAPSDSDAAAAAHADAAGDSTGVTLLLGLAQTAIDEHRLVAPVGSNAYEFYLSVLQLDPHNPMARQRLHEAFAPACDDVEIAINHGELSEAQRELRLLRDYDATNYKLALIGSYLDAKLIVLARQHAAQAQLISEREAAAAN